MPVDPYTLTVEIDGVKRPVASLEALLQDVATALQRAIVCIDVAYTRPMAHKTWERILYRALGGKLPEDDRRLGLYSNRDFVFASYEQDDAEWLVETGSPRSGVKTSLRTHRGEPWEVDTGECIPKTMVPQLIQEFVTTTGAPTSVKWRRT